MSLRQGTELRPLEATRAPAMAWLSPGLWCLPSRLFHEAYTSVPLPTFTVSSTRTLIEAAVAKLMEDPPNHSSIMQIQPSGERKMVLWVFTKRGWLDVVVLRLHELRDGGTLIRAHSWSTGFCPLVTPCAPLLNVLLCATPFGGINSARLALLTQEILRQASERDGNAEMLGGQISMPVTVVQERA